MRPRTAIIGVVALAGVIAAVACAPLQVRTYVPRDSDIRKYRTYGWAPSGAFETGDRTRDRVHAFVVGNRAFKGKVVKVVAVTVDRRVYDRR